MLELHHLFWMSVLLLILLLVGCWDISRALGEPPGGQPSSWQAPASGAG